MTIEAEFVSSLAEDALLFRRMEGYDALGRLYEVRLELLRHVDKTPLIKADEVLGTHVGVKIRNPDDSWRYVNGVCTRFERGGMVGRFHIYRLQLRPWLWELTLTTDCRIFQNKTAVQIIDDIFAEYAAASKVEKKLTGTPVTRPYTVQYNESDFNFVTRLMEQEGIYYYFKHEQGKHTLVLCNGSTGHSPAATPTLQWSPSASSNALREDIVTHWHRSHSLRSLKYSHTDYAAEAPTTSLMASATRSAPYPSPSNPKKYEVHRYPGGHDDGAMVAGDKVSPGTSGAEVEVARFESGHSIAEGITPEHTLVVGSTFTLEGEHEDAGDYLVTGTVFEMEFAGYEANADKLSTSYTCRFEAVPKAIRFMPEADAQPVRMRGPQTALVVGASADEIHTDEYGRVRIQFPWDRVGQKNEQSSAWVRVAQPWASKGFGAVFLPRVGDEVLVDFESGDPDHPIVVGSLYNGDNKHPWALPAQATVSGIKTRSSKQGSATTANELRFDDKKDSEYIWFQAEKDFHQLVKNDALVTVKRDRKTTVGRDEMLKITGKLDASVGGVAKLGFAADTHLAIDGDLNAEVGGATNLKSAGAIAIKGDGTLQVASGGAGDLSIGGALNITASGAVHIKGMGVVIDGGSQLCIKAGGAFILLGPEGVTIQGTLTKVNSGGSGGNANSAAQANPAAPEPPDDPTADTDPLAEGGGS